VRRATALAHRRRRRTARHLRPREPARRRAPRLGGQRQRQPLAAEPAGAARGLRPHHRLRAVRAQCPHAHGLPLRARPARRLRRSGRARPVHARAAQGRRARDRVFAAELAREGDDLQDVCAAAGGGDACTVLAGWDGQSDVDSVGAHVFREFWTRTPAERFEVPFDAAEPVTTPRDLDEGNGDVVTAMREAIAFLQDEGIAFDARLGDLQVAGDDGARASRSAAARPTRATPTSSSRTTRRPTRTRSTRSATARRTSRRSPSPTRASTPRRSSPTASRPTRRGAPRATRPSCSARSAGSTSPSPRRRSPPTPSSGRTSSPASALLRLPRLPRLRPAHRPPRLPPWCAARASWPRPAGPPRSGACCCSAAWPWRRAAGAVNRPAEPPAGSCSTRSAPPRSWSAAMRPGFGWARPGPGRAGWSSSATWWCS
jgi:hypothetical protein